MREVDSVLADIGPNLCTETLVSYSCRPRSSDSAQPLVESYSCKLTCPDWPDYVKLV